MDVLTKCSWSERNLWLLAEHIADVVPNDDLKSLNDRLDALDSGQRTRDAVDAVDAFVTAVRQEMVEEKLAEAEQAAWEKRMHINTVLDPVPVRVDARMRPVTS